MKETLKLFYNDKTGVINYSLGTKIVEPKIINGTLLKIYEQFSSIDNQTDYALSPVSTYDGSVSFRLVSAPAQPRGGGGRTGVNVSEDGTLLGFGRNLNFTGAGVTVSFSNGIATINIPDGGAGMIGGGGTLNRIPKFTPDGTHIGDSLLFDNGTTVQMGGIGAINSAAFAITSTTQGFLAPSMTTVQRNAIAAPAIGLLVYNNSTSLFSYWDGATWQNIDSQAGGDVSGSGTTNFVMKWTDGPNSVAGDSIIRDDGTNLGIAASAVAGTRLYVQSAGTTSATYVAQFFNSTPTEIFSVRSDGAVISTNGYWISTDRFLHKGGTTSSVYVGVGAGAIATATETDNIGIGQNALAVITSTSVNGIRNIAIGTGALSNLNDPSGVAGAVSNVAIGWTSGQNMTTGYQNTLVGSSCGSNITSGRDNTFIGRSVGIGLTGTAITTGTTNIIIGNGSDGTAAGTSSVIIIGINQTAASNGLNIGGYILGEINNKNLGLGTSTFGTSANTVFAIKNGTAPTTAPADTIQIFSVDSDDNTATLGLYLEQAVEAIGTFTASNKIKVKINGVLYWIELDAV